LPATNGASAGGTYSTGTRLINSLLASNAPGANCLGHVADLGCNLSSDSSCAFTNIGSLNNLAPKLGPLADNGGSSWTMALLAGSPAIDAGNSTAAPSIDQRFFPRPAGLAADMGAYEYCYPAMLRAVQTTPGVIDVRVYATSGQTCRLLTSTPLAGWTAIATNQVGADGTVLFQYYSAPGDSPRFFRAAIP
jgi:hypothetical protein